MKPKLLLSSVAALLLLMGPARAEDETSLDDLLAAFGWDFESTEIRSQQIAKGLHVLFGIGGNIAVSIGEQGVLIVDDQFPQLMPKIEKRCFELVAENNK